jgi:hypothetical protein
MGDFGQQNGFLAVKASRNIQGAMIDKKERRQEFLKKRKKFKVKKSEQLDKIHTTNKLDIKC